MTTFVTALLYFVLAAVLGILAFVLKKKHTPFPDFRVGYHHRELMESAQKWEYANRITGNLCVLFTAVALILAIVLLVVKIDGRLALLSFFFSRFFPSLRFWRCRYCCQKNWIRASFYPKRLEAET